MPKISYAEQMADWNRLLGNARPYVEDFDILGPILDELEERRARMEELYRHRQVLLAECHVATAEINRLRGEGKEREMQACNLLRSKFGINSPRLKAFNLRPRGKYKKRKKKDAAEGAAPGAGDAPPTS